MMIARTTPTTITKRRREVMVLQVDAVVPFGNFSGNSPATKDTIPEESFPKKNTTINAFFVSAFAATAGTESTDAMEATVPTSVPTASLPAVMTAALVPVAAASATSMHGSMLVASLPISTTHTTTLPATVLFPTTLSMPLQIPIHHHFIQQPPSQSYWNWNWNWNWNGIGIGIGI
eukprot:CAMPEP_0171003674 /NCGR_PEP_ID=MMETSP0736-20130129/17052_1 /TAXON_ID=186038 /ORGANISM="Fragilariopsis kerguelensis, Strain L26-C5" /LENGTH=175 /DNA_ID=CAMNT_0011432513 /DNA_START=327 /DNA_END=855 /DNA_ORIENTATION=-